MIILNFLIKSIKSVINIFFFLALSSSDQVVFNIYLQLGMIYWSHHLIEYWIIESLAIHINGWYFSFTNGKSDPELMRGALGRSLATPLKKNFGSLAFGALFLPITDFLNLIARKNNRVNVLG